MQLNIINIVNSIQNNFIKLFIQVPIELIHHESWFKIFN